MESNYQQLPPTTSSSNSYGQRVYKSRWTRERFRFIILRLILPILLLSIIITLFSISPINQSSLTLIDQCKDGSCLSWDKLHELAQRIGLDLSVKKLGTQSDRSSCVGPIRSKLKILHLIDRRTSEVLMDRWMIHSHDAVVEATDLYSSAVLWGPDFEGWQSSKTLTENIKDQFGSENYFDAVLVYFNNDQVKFLKIDPIPWFKQIKTLSQQGDGVIIIDRPHEMRDMRKEEFYKIANVSLVLAPYAYELFEYRKGFATQALLVHQPHFIKNETFFHPTTDPRNEPIIIAGDLGAFYPFRARLAEMIRRKTIPGWIRGHPGYEDIKAPSDRNSDITGQKQEQQLKDFGADLGRAKICLVTDSRWGYSVQKYIEAAAAGCLIVGNVPLDRQSSFSRVIVELSNKDSDEKIIETLNRWLKDDSGRIRKAKEAQDWVLDNFGMRSYAMDVFKMIWNVKQGQRGLVLPYEFDFLPKELPLDG